MSPLGCQGHQAFLHFDPPGTLGQGVGMGGIPLGAGAGLGLNVGEQGHQGPPVPVPCTPEGLPGPCLDSDFAASGTADHATGPKEAIGLVLCPAAGRTGGPSLSPSCLLKS